MEIVYCENCGTRIPESDMTSGKAVKSGLDYFCPDCVGKLGIRPGPPKPQPRRKTPRPMPRPRGPARTPARPLKAQAKGPRRAEGPPKTARQPRGPAKPARQPQAAARAAPRAEPARRMIVFAAAAAMAAFALTLGLILLLGRGRERKPAPRTRAPSSAPEEKVEPPEPKSLFAPRRRPEKTRPTPPAPSRTSKQKRLPAFAVRRTPTATKPPAAASSREPDLESARRAGEDWLKNRSGVSPKPYLEVTRALRPPVIDGELTDACWNAAARTTAFTWGRGNHPVPEQTAMLVCYDTSAVYVAFDCRDGDIKNVLRKATGTGKDVRADDSVELFFDAEKDYRTYVQFLANVDGVTDTYVNLGGKLQRTAAPGFEVKTKLYLDRWVVEFSLGYEALSTRPPGPGEVWAAQFVRNGRERGANESYNANWAKVWGGDTHRPQLFGFLSFK